MERVLGEAESRAKQQFSSLERGRRVPQIPGVFCKKEGVSFRELQAGSRRGPIPQVRSQLAKILVQELGIPLAEIARQVGVSTSAVSQILRRKQFSQSR